ncbi:hypothetical protein HY57_13270 [Dyella japonica A8]|uniref:Uncharacterized protein n=2 Tax=Dyella japonica TaxID=231455 RepID=A0A075K1D0_9GAMM|nr:hypothetical protein HY57_13270 [Dyella japonica A8]
MTRLMPLGMTRKSLSPHENFSQRILLALQALGVIEPELGQAEAEDWLLAKDWQRYGFDSVAWRIRWSPRDCRQRHDDARRLLSDIEPSEETLEALLAIWRDLALGEAIQYAGWSLDRFGYNPQWGMAAAVELSQALEWFSVGQVMYLVLQAARIVAKTHQQSGAGSQRLGEVFVSTVGSLNRRAVAEKWDVKDLARPSELPLSEISSIFAYEVTRLDEDYFSRCPNADALLNGLLRFRTLH